MVPPAGAEPLQCRGQDADSGGGGVLLRLPACMRTALVVHYRDRGTWLQRCQPRRPKPRAAAILQRQPALTLVGKREGPGPLQSWWRLA